MAKQSPDVQEYILPIRPTTELRVRNWFVNDDQAALHSVDGRKPMTYKRLRVQMDSTPTALRGRIALVCQTDETAEFATALLSLMDQGCTVCPLDPRLSSNDLCTAISQLRCNFAVASERSAKAFEITKLPTVTIKPDSDVCGAFTWIDLDYSIENKEMTPFKNPPLILLRTSGTTSKPKVVPLRAINLLYNARAIADSLELTREDCCLNVMPFFHIGGIACSLLAVLCSGGQVICAPTFESTSFIDWLQNYEPIPTWYYAVPTIHKSLLMNLQKQPPIKTALRLVRSGAAHLPHADAVALSNILGCTVMPTYSMSECMPVCSTFVGHQLSEKPDTVGKPIGPSMRIGDSEGNALPYGKQGEVLIRGPGVMTCYEGVSREKVFVEDEWLRTGDLGEMDRSGCVYLKGRIKEMIKRGGEQISLHEVDEALRSHPAVQVCVAFGIKNSFWGEEVAAAVVLNEDHDVKTPDQMQKEILTSPQIRARIPEYKTPKQILFVKNSDLPKTATGKYKRNGLANVLNASPVDNIAMKAIMMSPAVPKAELSVSNRESVTRAREPSKALHGLRFVVALFVTQFHIGLFPYEGWAKIQSFSMNMTGFTLLAGFMVAYSTTQPILRSNTITFYVSRYGSLHPIYLISWLYAFPAWVIRCQPTSCTEEYLTGTFTGDATKWIGTVLSYFPLSMLGFTAGAPKYNAPAWFQGMLYLCILIFPPFDRQIRKGKWLCCWLTPCLSFSTAVYTVYFIIGLSAGVHFSWASWVYCFCTGVIVSHIFKRSTNQKPPNEIFWMFITDGLSILFICICVLHVFNECLGTRWDFSDLDGWICEDITYDEWLASSTYKKSGRWETKISSVWGLMRLCTPFVALWIYGLAVGKGLTARLFSIKFMVKHLSPLAYPLYLFHVPTAYYYWYITRGTKFQEWMPASGAIPIPVMWYEYFIITFISLLISYITNEWLNPSLIPSMMRFWRWFFTFFHCVFFWLYSKPSSVVPISDEEAQNVETTLYQVQKVIRDLTGTEAMPESSLDAIGLDSFGVSALVGVLRLSFSFTRNLRVADVRKLQNVQSLVDHLDDLERKSNN